MRITFNTRRFYSAKGQRIAAAALPCGRVYFVDADRRLDYVTVAPCGLNQPDIMDAYDYNATVSAYEGIADAETRDALRAELEALARSI